MTVIKIHKDCLKSNNIRGHIFNPIMCILTFENHGDSLEASLEAFLEDFTSKTEIRVSSVSGCLTGCITCFSYKCSKEGGLLRKLKIE